MYTKDDSNSNNPARPTIPGAENKDPQRSHRGFAGILVVIIGAVLLARQMDAELPYWLFNIGPILIAVGLYIGVKSNFKNWTWVVVAGFGVLVLTAKIAGFSVSHLIGPLIIISVGLVLLLKPKRDKDTWKNWGQMSEESTGDDFFDSTAIFGAIKKNIISKNFKGGDVTTIFGGAEINLGQADISGKAVIDMTHIFGGSKIIVPADWSLKTDDLVCIFGGLDDKRRHMGPADPNKVLVLHGTCIFGGIDIKSY
jgi:predicted membrane protein